MDEATRKVQTVIAECERCGGTGIYPGTPLPSGIGKVCSFCQGRGWRKIHYHAFTGRRIRKDVQRVKDAVIDGRGALHSHNWGDEISYKQFLAVGIPKPPSGS